VAIAFLRATALPAGTAECVRISYVNSARRSPGLSRAGEIETPGFHHI